jgi:peroxiredoxin
MGSVMKRVLLVSIVALIAWSLLASRPVVAADKADTKPATKPSLPPLRAGAKAPAKPKPAAKPGPPKDATQIEPAKLTMPKVVLSDAHGKTCLVKVGDALPDGQLKDLKGKPQSLASLFGKKLTVVLFWQNSSPYGVEALADLQPDVAEPYAAKDVKVIAIDEGDTAEAVAAIVKRLGVTVPVLLDGKGELLAKIATRRLPRTYLVDDQGKILWFDIEYSNTTRRDLHDAIRVVLNDEG